MYVHPQHLFPAKTTVVIWFLLVLSACSAPSQPVGSPAEQQAPTRRQLLRNFFDTGKMLIVYGTGDSETAKRYQKIGNRLKEEAQRTDITVRSDQEVTETELKSQALYILGSPSSNDLLRKLSPELPFDYQGDSILFDGQTYTDKEDILSISFIPNPYNDQLPLSFVTGCNDTELCFFLEKPRDNSWGGFMTWYTWGYQVYREGTRRIMGFFAQDSSKRWELDHEQHWDFSRTSRKLDMGNSDLVVAEQEDIDESLARDLYKELKVVTDSLFNLSKLLPRPAKYSFPTLHLYSNAEDKGLLTRSTDQASFEGNTDIHVICNDKYLSYPDGQAALPFVYSTFGRSQHEALSTGLAVYYTRYWQDKGLNHLVGKLHRAGQTPKIADLLDNGYFKQGSRYINPAYAGALVGWIMETEGKKAFLAYLTGQKAISKLTNKDKAWQEWLQAISDQQALPYLAEEQKKQEQEFPYQKGWNFAHEGYQIYNGYLSRASRVALEKTVDIGSNAVAIIPYTGMGDPNTPQRLPFVRGGGAENDESVIFVAENAKRANMITMLKPQVYLWKAWPGAVEMKNQADWDRFFEYYETWIMHYAMLAEIRDLDIFCVGVEFKQATLKQPKRWRELIAKVRKLYSGKITYAANWGEEFEKIEFWDAVDYIGLNSYYPLSNNDNPGVKELTAGFREVNKKARTVSGKFGNKKILFTEIGFRSLVGPWKHPHEESFENVINNDEHQERCYKAMIEALSPMPDWCKGIYLWKWPAYMQQWEAKNTGFTPCGKLAEKQIEDWFNSIKVDKFFR